MQHGVAVALFYEAWVVEVHRLRQELQMQKQHEEVERKLEDGIFRWKLMVNNVNISQRSLGSNLGLIAG